MGLDQILMVVLTRRFSCCFRSLFRYSSGIKARRIRRKEMQPDFILRAAPTGSPRICAPADCLQSEISCLVRSLMSDQKGDEPAHVQRLLKAIRTSLPSIIHRRNRLCRQLAVVFRHGKRTPLAG